MLSSVEVVRVHTAEDTKVDLGPERAACIRSFWPLVNMVWQISYVRSMKLLKLIPMLSGEHSS